MNRIILFLNPENVGLGTKIMMLDEILPEIMWLWDFENLLLKMGALKNGNIIYTGPDINKNAFIIVGNN